jgi:hypothetical protein
MTSYITLLSKIEAFCNAHLQIKKYKGEFREQMPNFSTEDEKYPVVFVSPTSDIEDMNTNQFTVDIYCVDIIQKDRANLNTALSDCHLILKDLYTYYKDDGDSVVDVVGTANLTPLNNFDLDYVVGWVMSITFEVGGYGKCAIPMNPIPPFEPSCEDATYEITDTDLNILYSGSIVSGGNLDQIITDSTVVNSDATYSVSVLAEGSLVLPDITVTDSDGSSSSFPSAKNVTCTPSPDTDLEVNGVLEGSVVAGSTVDIQLSDSNGVVTPDSVTQVGNDLQIVLPDAVAPTPVGATLMKTGQTTSYRTGDDGDLEAGRATNFTTLAVNNPFGNTNRFTDELGGQTYTNNWIIDWSTYQGNTVLGYYRTVQSAASWNTAIDNSVGTFGTFSGCRLMNLKEWMNIYRAQDIGFLQPLNYSPFNITVSLWLSTSLDGFSTNAFSTGGASFTSSAKTSNVSYIPVRTFTVTGTILS